MRKLAAVVAAGFAALTANVALACQDKVETAEQPQQKPAVAKKTQKPAKQQKAKKGDTSRTTVARSDRS